MDSPIKSTDLLKLSVASSTKSDEIILPRISLIEILMVGLLNPFDLISNEPFVWLGTNLISEDVISASLIPVDNLEIVKFDQRIGKL